MGFGLVFLPEPGQFGDRPGMVVGAQVDIGEGLPVDHQQGGRGHGLELPARFLAGRERIEQAAGQRLIRLDEILYAELLGRTVRYHLVGQTHLDTVTLRGSFLKETAPLLEDTRFFQCGASFLANLFYVTAVEKGFLRMDGGARVPLARGLTALARQRWQDYWLNGPKGG